jgi:proline dehydrogenase
LKYPTIYPTIKRGFGLRPEEVDGLQSYASVLDQRLKSLFNYAVNKNSSIMIDAEQTYLQIFIDYMVAYYFKIYNTESCLLWNTLQCYLKKEKHNLIKWRGFCDENKLKLGLKLVRGAYMTEETNISREKGLPSPICNSLEDTNNNYDYSIKYLFENYKQDDKVISVFNFSTALPHII